MNDSIAPLSISKKNNNSSDDEFPDKAWSLSEIHDSSPQTAASIHKDISTNPPPPPSPPQCPSPSIIEFGFTTSNLPQLVLHWILAALIGISLRTTTFPQALIAADMGVNNYTRETSFLVAFGFTKALSNLVVGWASDLYGRKVPHAFGWGAGLVLASLLLSADRSFGSSSSSSSSAAAADDTRIDSDDPTKGWTQYVIADIFLGVQQGFTWTTNVFLFTDVLGPEHRALASGVSNATGYLASAAATYLAAGIGVDRSFEVVMLCSVLGVALSVFAMKDTINFVGREVVALEEETEVVPEEEDDGLVAAGHTIAGGGTATSDRSNYMTENEDGMFPKDTPSQIETKPLPSTQSFRTTFTTTTYHNKSTAVLCLGGLVTNLVTSLSWGLVTIWAKQQSIPSQRLATLNATFTIAKAVSQLLIGYVSDRLPTRRPVLVAGFSTVALGLAITAAADSDSAHHLDSVYSRLLYGGILTGTGVGSVYCVMTGAVGDHTHPSARAGAVGVYKLWRDGGYAVGGLGTGLLADAAGGSFGISVGCVGMVVVVTVVVIALGYGEAVRSGGESSTKKRREQEEWHEIRNLENIT